MFTSHCDPFVSVRTLVSHQENPRVLPRVFCLTEEPDVSSEASDLIEEPRVSSKNIFSLIEGSLVQMCWLREKILKIVLQQSPLYCLCWQPFPSDGASNLDGVHHIKKKNKKI